MLVGVSFAWLLMHVSYVRMHRQTNMHERCMYVFCYTSFFCAKCKGQLFILIVTEHLQLLPISENNKTIMRPSKIGICSWDLAEREWDVAKCGRDLAECGWDLAGPGWDLGEFGWDIAECGWVLANRGWDLAELWQCMDSVYWTAICDLLKPLQLTHFNAVPVLPDDPFNHTVFQIYFTRSFVNNTFINIDIITMKDFLRKRNDIPSLRVLFSSKYPYAAACWHLQQWWHQR